MYPICDKLIGKIANIKCSIDFIGFGMSSNYYLSELRVC